MKQRLLVIATLVLSIATTSSAIAQQSSASQRSYQQARRVLDDGIQAMGGLEALRGTKISRSKKRELSRLAIKVQSRMDHSSRGLQKNCSSSITTEISCLTI
jgi:hypothetical protein